MTYNKKPNRNTMFKKTIRLGLLDSATYSWDDIVSILPDIPFNLININLSARKSEIGMNGNGFTPIGFVNKFYSDEEGNCLFDVAIFNKFRDSIDLFEETPNSDLVITPRVFTNKENKITKIIGLDITLVEAE